MIKIFSIILLFSFSVQVTNAQQEEENVRLAFENYKNAILDDNGKEAMKHVDSNTMDYYSNILLKIVSADSLGVDSLNIMDKFMVFFIRHHAPINEIISFDGEALLLFAIQEGMVGKNSVANNSIGAVEIDEDFAKGQFIANGQETQIYFHFNKEADNWKVDLTSIFPVGIGEFKRMQEESGQEENEYLFYLLEIITGNKPGSEIWNKIK